MAQFTEVTRTSWGSRLGKSIRGIGFGLIIFVLAFPLLFWNESRAVKVARTLDEGQGIVEPTLATTVEPSLEGKLVHMTGLANTQEVLQDGLFGISTQAIKLSRQVEMYQWKETSNSQTKNKTGGSQETTTTYDYERVWSAGPIASGSFKVAEGHQNPTSMPYSGEDWTAQNVSLGAYTLSESLTGKINNWQPLSLSETELNSIAQQANVTVEPSTDWVYLNYFGSSAAPAIGDLRIRYEIVPETTISIVSQQEGNSFKVYQSKYGSSINMLSIGEKTPTEMFEAAEKANTAMTWGLRVLGFLMMAGGLAAVLAPLVILADVLPFLGSMLRAGSRLIAGVLAFFFAFITIAIAWLAVRPILGFSLIALAAIVLVAGIVLSRQRSKRVATSTAVA